MSQDDGGWHRVVLGTVQIGVPYGRRRAGEVLPLAEAHAILEEAWARGVRAFDTAETYGCAADRLARWLEHAGRAGEAMVVTKVPLRETASAAAVATACRRFANAASLTVLTHGAIDDEAYGRFREATASAGAQAGQSVYTAAELTAAAAHGAARVQAPHNVVDVRQLRAAHAAGVPLDARSVYLQGVLLDAPEAAERRVPGSGRVAAAVQAAAQHAELAPAVALLAGALAELAAGDRVVIGIDDPAQLDDVAAGLGAPPQAIAEFLAGVRQLRNLPDRDPALFDPRTWS